MAVPLAAVDAGMEQADVEAAAVDGRVVAGEVVLHLVGGEPLAVDRRRGFVVMAGLGPVDVHLLDVVGQAEVAGHLVPGVVIAADEVDPDAGVAEVGHPPGEPEARVVVLPVAVVDVAGDEDEGDLLRDRQADQVLERPTGRPADLLDGAPLIPVEPPQGAVEVDVGGVEELEHRIGARPRRGRSTSDRPADDPAGLGGRPQSITAR